jgi:pimeloyl-[acyl-carrier protein] methyl ester esterase
MKSRGNMKSKWQIIAIHGWGSNHHCWETWQAPCKKRGWELDCYERGYGSDAPYIPEFKTYCNHALIVNSLGLHLTPKELLKQANAVILLASFGRFIPEGEAGIKLIASIKAMEKKIKKNQIKELFDNFRTIVASPQNVELLPAGIEDQEVSQAGSKKLIADLELLRSCNKIPEEFPEKARCLIVEALEDKVVDPDCRKQLKAELSKADVISLKDIGHGLIINNLQEEVLNWLGKQ